MKARIYGSANRQGPIKEFAVVEKLPTKGEPVMLGEPDFIWGGAEKAMLDPEQRHRDENELGDYDFYVVPEINVEDGEAVAVHYFAVKRPEPVLNTEYAIINHGIEKAPYHNEDVLFESQDSEEIVAKLIECQCNDSSESVEIYTVTDKGDFYEGSDFKTVSDFLHIAAVQRSVKQICQMAGMSQNAVADRFEIPHRTFGNWCTGVRECPEYTKLMMQELLGLYVRQE